MCKMMNDKIMKQVRARGGEHEHYTNVPYLLCGQNNHSNGKHITYHNKQIHLATIICIIHQYKQNLITFPLNYRIYEVRNGQNRVQVLFQNYGEF